jgi:cobalt/nickel transport system permease protein
MLLWAVHISDGVLDSTWQLAGFSLAGLLALVGLWRLREEDLPATALLAAAFFTASSIHVRVGPSSVHLLLNGLVGVILGRRAALAIPAGLFLQAALLSHGGYGALGVNSCVMALPALLAGWLFGWLHRPRLAPILLGLATLLLAFSVLASITLLVTNPLGSTESLDLDATLRIGCHPYSVSAALLLACGAAYLGQRHRMAVEFTVGMFIGEVTVLLTLMLNATALVLGGAENFNSLAVLLFALHLPIAVIEGIVVGFTVSFLARVKPQLLGLSARSHPCGEPECP